MGRLSSRTFTVLTLDVYLGQPEIITKRDEPGLVILPASIRSSLV